MARRELPSQKKSLCHLDLSVWPPEEMGARTAWSLSWSCYRHHKMVETMWSLKLRVEVEINSIPTQLIYMNRYQTCLENVSSFKYGAILGESSR